jgi:hypothetical protein
MEISSSPLSSPPPGLDDCPGLSPTLPRSKAIFISSDSDSDFEDEEEDEPLRCPNLATDQQNPPELHRHNTPNLTPAHNHQTNNSPPPEPMREPRSYSAQASEAMNDYTTLDHATSSPPGLNPPIKVLLVVTPQPATLNDQAAFEEFGVRFCADFGDPSSEEMWTYISLYSHYREWAQLFRASMERQRLRALFSTTAAAAGLRAAPSAATATPVFAPRTPINNTRYRHVEEVWENGAWVDKIICDEDEDEVALSGGGVSEAGQGAGPSKDPSVVGEATTDTADGAIGSIHHSALLTKLEQEVDVHWRSFLPVLQHLIELEVEKGARQFIIGGMKIGDLAGIRAFVRKVSPPNSCRRVACQLQIMLTRELCSQIIKPVGIIVFLPGDVSSVSGSPIVPAELERHTVMVSALFDSILSRRLANFSPNHQVHPPRASLQTYKNALAAIYKKGFPDLFFGKAAVIDLMGDSSSSEDETDRGEFDGEDRVMGES